MLKSLLSKQCNDLALLIGNGVNQYNAKETENSWEHLLGRIATTYIGPLQSRKPEGITHTEFYDVLELARGHHVGQASLAEQFCDLMVSWRPLEQHHNITKWAIRNSIPLLTTNFENTLGEASGCVFHKPKILHYTARYPWGTYYSNCEVLEPCSEFAIWHIHGIQKYPSSIRLGLTDYMGAVSRARDWLHKGQNRLMGNQGGNDWLGTQTWLQIFFHKPLLIIGQGLSETEVFLRWLLIERAKYFKLFPNQKKLGWFVHKVGQLSEGKGLFLRSVGIDPICVNDYNMIYSKSIWK